MTFNSFFHMYYHFLGTDAGVNLCFGIAIVFGLSTFIIFCILIQGEDEAYVPIVAGLSFGIISMLFLHALPFLIALFLLITIQIAVQAVISKREWIKAFFVNVLNPKPVARIQGE